MKPRPSFELEIRGRKVRLGDRTVIMGVLNVTPDSFSDGGQYFAHDRAIRRGLELARQGADWIDVGGESTRPGSKPVSAEEELRRVLPVIRALAKRIRRVPISIDTTKAEVAEQALRAGASIINDVSGLRFDARLADLARRYRTPLVLMHFRGGRPETMQRRPFARSIWRSVRRGLVWSIRRALAAGVNRSQLIIDPGAGFGKSRRQNFEILAHLERLHKFNLPVLVGTSRKSFVQAVAAGAEIEPSKNPSKSHWKVLSAARVKSAIARSLPITLLTGDAACVTASLLCGAHIVRVHDVASILAAVRIADAVLEAARPLPN